MDKNRYPVDEICEKTILGILLLQPEENLSVVNDLSEEDFYRDNCRNRYLFTAIKSLALNDCPIDMTSVYNFLNEKKTIQIIGGFDYLKSLLDLVIDTDSINYYVDSLKRTTLLRTYLMKLDEAENEYLSKPMDDIEGYINKYQSELIEIANRRKSTGFDALHDVAIQIDERIKASLGNAGEIKGYSTGFSNLDKKINGLRNGNMIIIAGRPGMGKSTFSLNIGYNVARITNKPVGYFSLEMESDRLATKLFAAVATVDSRRIENGYLDKNERAKLSEAKERLMSVPFYIDDKRTNTMDDIYIKSKKLKDKYGELGLIIIDHIGITDKEKGRKFASDTEELSYKSRQCKKIAGELDCPVICVSQLNRQVEARGGTRVPEMADLRGSGSLEQDADQVLLLYRERYYEDQGISQSKDNKQSNENNENSNKPEIPLDAQLVQINIAKNRDGELSQTHLFFFPKYSRFDTPTDESLKRLSEYSKAK